MTLAMAGRSNATPWVAAQGPFVAVVWGGSSQGVGTDVFLAVSRDAGRSFGAPVRVNVQTGEAQLGGERTPRVALVPARAGDPEIVVLWTAKTPATVVRIARSRDGGRTFGAPSDLQGAGAVGNRGWASLAVDAKGVAHAMWLDHRGTVAEAAAAPAHIHGEGGEHTMPSPAAGARDPVASAQRSGLYYAASSAEGASVRELFKGVCYCCKTTVAVGPSGTVAAVWRHVYPGNFRDIGFTMSRDGGRTFSPQGRVSEDGWSIDGCPEDGPTVVVDAAGTAHVVWPTVIGGAMPQGALFYASTRDGRNFTPRQRIPTLGGPKPEHPSLAIDAAGRLVVAWDEYVGGQRVAALRTLAQSAGAPVRFGEIVRLGSDLPSSYPVLASTTNGVIAAWTNGPSAAGTIGVRVIHDGR